ncbi:hypothetical protein MIND_00870400 [Mycena indigotica]|uniref:KOW domain-containing protein n=1 Tax=Mycena indigotica TaxID=2126181 RepID=A0A8H6SJ07_9AGAR|nr:uncharacterized protein MIND_00870400 [Mycena indigotica]KAF7299217.1 hypothetical protein MIND_00870400 [Mycena indigotica]
MSRRRPQLNQLVSGECSTELQATTNRPKYEEETPNRPLKRSCTPPVSPNNHKRPQISNNSSSGSLPMYQWVHLKASDPETGIRAGQLALVVAQDTLITVVPRERLHGSSSSSTRTIQSNTLAELQLDDGTHLPSMVNIAPQPSPSDLHLWEQLATDAKWFQTAYCRQQGAAFLPGCRVVLPFGGSGFIMQLSPDGTAQVRVAVNNAPFSALDPNFVQRLQTPMHEDDVVTFDMSCLRRHLFSGIPAPLVGDRIYVVRGRERGMLGRVISIDSGQDPLVIVETEQYHTREQVPMSCMVRHFVERDLVKIVHGYHAGEVGTVIRTFPLIESARKGVLDSAIEVFPLNGPESPGPKGYKVCRVLTQHVVFWHREEPLEQPRKPEPEPDNACRSSSGYSRVLAQRVAFWDDNVNSPSSYSPSSASGTPEHLSPLVNSSPQPDVHQIGNDEGRWLCIPTLSGKRIDVIIMPIRHGRVTNVQADAVGRSGFIELDQPLTEALLKVPINVYVDGLQKRIRLAPKWLAPMRSALPQPVQPTQDVSIAQAAKGRVVIIGPDVRGSVSQLGQYANITGAGPGDVVLVQFEREWFEPVSQAQFHLQSLCRSTNLDGKQTKATRFY